MKREDLKKFDGKEGRPAYIAFEGKVYDVSVNKYWKNGIHMLRHKAGEDLTEFMKLAPHNMEVLEKCKIVGTLEEEIIEVSEEKQHWRDWYNKYHPHPMLIHFPMGLIYFSAFMFILYLIFKVESFDTTAVYSLVGAIITLFPAAIAGFISWIINYNAKINRIFKNKIVFTIIFTFTSFLTLYIRLTVGDVFMIDGVGRYLYIFLYFINLPAISFVAYNGGKLTWPQIK
jgi:predicted heme/steroid binding protein/uncharacterized membrane protein